MRFFPSCEIFYFYFIHVFFQVAKESTFIKHLQFQMLAQVFSMLLQINAIILSYKYIYIYI